ncbi:hypothetical protein BpHYR1_024156 [Brachionus plicatilis]|uniref:Uncharacterized protein n=1 Tax=Brachionus plicatilis TaxID=10195 RepID=A0A3M7S7U8_BRAPC|nr:hypothetical protein BpHYR1_024156 [Brachionus plicatilis]
MLEKGFFFKITGKLTKYFGKKYCININIGIIECELITGSNCKLLPSNLRNKINLNKLKKNVVAFLNQKSSSHGQYEAFLKQTRRIKRILNKTKV